MCTLSFSVVTLWNGSTIHAILQARILKWVAISSCRGSSWLKDQTRVSCVTCIGRQTLHHCATCEASHVHTPYLFYFSLCWVFIAVVLFSSCSRWGPLSSCSALPFHCDDFSYCRTQAPGCLGFSSCGTRAPEHRLSSCGAWAQLLCSMWILLVQGSNPCPLHWQVNSLPLSHQGSPSPSVLKFLFFSSAPSFSLLLIWVPWVLDHQLPTHYPFPLIFGAALSLWGHCVEIYLSFFYSSSSSLLLK